ncbi:hypothetical protein ACFS5J_11290 [Flavobacterium chuncheonense]|uniref:Uncharacterized protein n=1 Tax=Flavobacterium chuncheonense TaxID=2026653 RepID=A0ABW5YNK3_9FLAO
MSVQICTCEGLNPKCKKCFGSGYMNTNIPEKASEQKASKKNNTKTESYLPENIEVLQVKEIQNITYKLIDKLDLKSKQQMRILHSIPFKTNTFRRDFKDKFESLRIMENEKRLLRKELNTLASQLTQNNFSFHFKFNHLLSDKDIDVTSNRELKTLLREYKKLKK